MNKIIFLSDSSNLIGSGHVKRCMALAHELKAHSDKVTFVGRDLNGNIFNQIKENGFDVVLFEAEKDQFEITKAEKQKFLDFLIREKPNMVIIDHYGFDVEFEKTLKGTGSKVFVIDDFPKNEHDCDFYLNQNYQTEEEKELISARVNGRLFLGPNYSLLRDEVLTAKKDYVPADRSLVAINFGGSDPVNLTLRVVEALIKFDSDLPKEMQVKVIVGSGYSEFSSLQSLNLTSKIEIIQSPSNFIEIVSMSKLFIGAGGTSSLERCYLGIPCLQFSLAENQVAISENLNEAEVIKYIGFHDNFKSEKFIQILVETYKNEETLKALSKKGTVLVSGNGIKEISKEIYR